MLGDVLEWLALACLVTAAALWCGWILALAVAGVGLAYEAQCHAATPLRRKRKK